MIGIAHAVSYGINTLRYIKGESEKKRHPEKIYHVCNQFLPNDIDAMGMWTMMNFKINSHPGMKNGLFHVELSPAKECTDNFTMADWKRLWSDCVEEFDKQQLYDKEGKMISKKTSLAGSMASVWLHQESKSGIPHLHAAVCRVDMQGNTNNDHRIDIRVQRAAEIVAVKYGWMTARKVRDRNVDLVSQACMNALRQMPRWDWNDYVARLEACGYTPKLKRDRQNQVVSYIICKGWTKYKASELGRGRKLTVKNIENTWKALHQEAQKIVAPTLKENQEMFADKPISAMFSHKSCQSGSVNHYTERQPGSSCVNIEWNGESYSRFVPKKVTQAFDEVFDYRVEGNWQSLTNLALAYFTMLATPSVTSSVGGGASNNEGWGRKRDEDELDWAYRCAKAAIHAIGRKPKKGMRR